MAATNAYATTAQFKARLDIVDDADDTVLEQVLEAASRAIDGWCARQFYTETATRTFTAEAIDFLAIPDLYSITSLKTDADGDRTYETTWASTDYDLDPEDAPYTAITLTPAGRYAFPTLRRSVQIAGDWGYSATAPHAIREACLLQASRYFLRKDAPFGVTGSTEHGQLQTISSIDPDVKQLILPYRNVGMEVI